MRHFRTRKRFRAILLFFIIICVVLFVESSIDALVPQLKVFAGKKIEKMFADKLNISIGAVDGGILRPFVFNDIEIKSRKEEVFFPALVINNIRTNYRIWDIFLKRKADPLVSNLLPDDSCIYINFSTRNKAVSGFGRLEGNLDEPKIKGRINFFENSEKIDFVGSIKEDSFDLELRPASGVLRARVTIPQPNELVVDFKLEHLKLYGFDIACEGVLKNRVISEDGGPIKRYLEGEVETKKIILNYKPFIDISTSYKISGGVLTLKDLRIGEIFAANGNVKMEKPYETDLTILADNVSLTWLMSSLGGRESASVLSGTMNGKFGITGPALNPRSDIHLDIRKGKISDLIDFDRLTATFKGEGPIIRIEESRITRESGFFVIAGEMDLGKMGKASFFDNIKLASDEKAITWDAWSSTRLNDVEEIRMKKRLNDDINVDVKKIVDDDKIDEGVGYKDEIRLEYKLQPDDSLRMGVGQDNDFFGFEHKSRF